ncbi:MAG: 6-carboxytetrahydropterin synthase [Bdellovibrionota bacterium]
MATPSLFHSLFLSDFTVLDCATADLALGICGASFYVSAELFGSLDSKDFLFDFSTAKKALKALVDESCDHKLLVPQGLATARAGGLTWGNWDYECPESALEQIPEAEITASAIEAHLARLASSRMPANVSGVKFTLRTPERFRGEASFRYTHGLRFHEGNCQRLFHGHRNPVEVWVGGARAPEWEARLASEWSDAHFVTASTLLNQRELDLPLGRRRASHMGYAEVGYESSQGRFWGRLPASRVILTSAEPSIETLSALVLEVLRDAGLRGKVKVVAYEGLNKGASSSAEL